MKNYLFIAFIIGLFLIPNVISAVITPIEISTDGQVHKIILRDGVRFNFKGGEHVVQVKKIDDKGAYLAYFPYIERESSNEDEYLPLFVSLKEKDLVNMDVDRNLKRDLTIGVVKIDGNETFLLFKELNESSEDNTVELPDNKTTDKEKESPKLNYSIIWTIILVVFAVVLLYFALKRKKS